MRTCLWEAWCRSGTLGGRSRGVVDRGRTKSENRRILKLSGAEGKTEKEKKSGGLARNGTLSNARQRDETGTPRGGLKGVRIIPN